MPEKFYLTTPLYYVNAKPHIGHAYTEIAADVLARYHRLRGEKVFFLTGTDEHGQKVAKAAAAEGLSPQVFTDKISRTFKDLWKLLNIEKFEFIRTTDKKHIQTVQEVWRRLEKNGELYRAKYSGWYCTPDETFWTEGQALKEGDKMLCPDCRRPLERIDEENYFFKISKYQRWLADVIRKGEEIKILPDARKNEVLGFLDNNELQDLCISRPKSRLAWGIPSPLSEAHVTYVWFDALINYISGVGYPWEGAQNERWPADVHLIGKDILRHHAIYWTILLKALGLNLPKMIFAHGWWTVDGEKMSKSRGNAVDPVAIVESYGVDAYRYFLLRETPFGQDGTFSEEALILRYNTDLANNLGNLLSRTLTMCEKYFEGRVPEMPKTKSALIGEVSELKTFAGGLFSRLEAPMSSLAFSEVLALIWEVVDRANRFIEKSAPWTLAKEKKIDELKAVLAALAETLDVLSKAVGPFMPGTAEAIQKQLGAGGAIAKGAPLFPRIEIKK